MVETRDQFDIITDAIGAVRLIRGHWASTVEGVKRIDELVDVVRAAALNLPVRHGLRHNDIALAFADAISQHYGSNRKLE